VALSDFWELKDNQVAGSHNMLNVYYVKRILVGANATKVGQSFIDSVIVPHLLPMQVINTDRTSLDIKNLGDVTDFVSLDTSALVGLRLGESLSNFNAVGIRFNRTRTDIRNGWKRYFAGNENDKVGNVWDATFKALIDALAAELIEPWEEDSAPGVDVCEQVILKRFCVIPEEDPCQKYRLPETDAEIDGFHYVPVSTLQDTLVTSQVSRKRTV